MSCHGVEVHLYKQGNRKWDVMLSPAKAIALKWMSLHSVHCRRHADEKAGISSWDLGGWDIISQGKRLAAIGAKVLLAAIGAEVTASAACRWA